jgi:hypothetical protein
MSISKTNTPASTSTSVTTTGNEMLTLADEVKKYDTAKLIEYLQGQKNLELSETAVKILEKEEITGQDFFDLTEEKLEKWKMSGGPAMRLVKFAKKCKDKKLRSFFSYKTKKDLKEVLAKYGVQNE